MESSVTAIRPSTSRESLLELDLNTTESIITPEPIENSPLIDINAASPISTPRPRAESVSSDDIKAYVCPKVRLEKLRDDVQATLKIFRETTHPLQESSVYDCLEACERELNQAIENKAKPHILQMKDYDPSGFQPEGTIKPTDQPPK